MNGIVHEIDEMAGKGAGEWRGWLSRFFSVFLPGVFCAAWLDYCLRLIPH